MNNQKLNFYKYQGTGNDFILLDNRDGNIRLSRAEVAFLCHRRFGIGADGLMLLETYAGFDFYMRYYNSDGAESSMCGNGGRCITAFAQKLGIITGKAHFCAIDGPHLSEIGAAGWVRLKMQDVNDIRQEEGFALLDTGSPHLVQWSSCVADEDVTGKGRSIRNEARFAPGGVNVNFVAQNSNGLTMRTYERGVEDETLSCGTGATAAAIAATAEKTGAFETNIETPGGNLLVSFYKPTPDSARQVWLSGPATFVFEGTISLKSD